MSRDSDIVDPSGWLEYRRRLAYDRFVVRQRLKRRAARDKPCPRCGEFCQSAPHFRVGFEPARRRRAPKCPKG